MIVVDSSILIGYLRGHTSPAILRFHELEKREVPFLLPALCYQEVLQGAKDEREWRVLGDYLGSQELLLPHDLLSTHQGAARIYFDCRRIGLTVRSSMDCFLAQMILDVGAVLLHDDDDFDSISQVRPLKTLRG